MAYPSRLHYKGYTAACQWYVNGQRYTLHIQKIPDVICFSANTIPEAETKFHEIVDTRLLGAK